MAKKLIDTRSSKVRLKFVNQSKLDWLNQCIFSDGLNDMMSSEINDVIYNQTNIAPKPDKAFTDRLVADYGVSSARLSRVLAAEISSQARSIITKLDKARQTNDPAPYQMEIRDKYAKKKLKVEWDGNLHLDSRFVDIQERKVAGHFFYWAKISIPFNGTKFFPFKKTKHMKSLEGRGYTLKTNTLLVKRTGEIELVYQRPFTYKDQGETLGIDIGRNKIFVTSNNEMNNAIKLLIDICSRTHGSKKQQSLVRRYKQFIDWAIRHGIDLTKIKTINLEDLRGIKYKKKYGRFHHHWNHAHIKKRLQGWALENDVLSRDINPAYTSQICISCGHVHQLNRHSEEFKCLACGNMLDADFNAAINIARK